MSTYIKQFFFWIGASKVSVMVTIVVVYDFFFEYSLEDLPIKMHQRICLTLVPVVMNHVHPKYGSGNSVKWELSLHGRSAPN